MTRKSDMQIMKLLVLQPLLIQMAQVKQKTKEKRVTCISVFFVREKILLSGFLQSC